MSRVRAPELVGRGWVGTGGRTLSLADLRGRFVLLDFWTFCCINCLHVLDELRPVEQRWADVLTVVGVHSPKFRHEADPAALADAVLRHGVAHPVLDDADLRTWQAYTARAWPTLVLVDPEGTIVATYAGEGHAHAVDALLATLVPQAEARGVLRRGPFDLAARQAGTGTLLFPGGAVRLPEATWLVADTAHHRLVRLADDLSTVMAVVGSGRRGLVDGVGGAAAFAEPQGMCLLPARVASAAGYDVVVADTANHALRGVRLDDLTVTTLAGDGRPWTLTRARGTLSSPWDVAWWQQRVWVAMAGVHQLWTFDPGSGACEPAAGTRTEGVRDGPLGQAWFAQPSGLAPDSERLWVADAETSALRVVQDGAVRTVVGSGLFDFGFADGPGRVARLQHPLGVAVLADGAVAVADTYNGAIRRYDPRSDAVTTIASGLAEPVAVVPDQGTGDLLVVVESAAHRLVRVPAGTRVEAPERAEHSERAPTALAAGEVALTVAFAPPPGQAMDERYGPSTRLSVTATPAALLVEGAGAGRGLSRRLVLDPAVGGGVLHVTASASSCSVGGHDGSEPEPGAACHLHQQDWGIPVVVCAEGMRKLSLALAAQS
jgi:thiol-disulfide isomerase/thioredoxin